MLKYASPDAFEVLLDLICYHSYNPIATALTYKGKVEKKVTQSLVLLYLFHPQLRKMFDYEQILQWRGVAERLQQRAVRYLDAVQKLPKGFRYAKDKEKLLQGNDNKNLLQHHRYS